MNKTEAYEKMKRYELLLGQVQLVDEMLKDEIDDVIGEVGLQEIEKLKGDYGEKLRPKKDEMKLLEKELRAFVVEEKKPLKGRVKQVIYTKPKTIVDVKGLVGYAVDKPALQAFISKGPGGTQIRVVKK